MTYELKFGDNKVMPTKHKLPQWERQDNRAEVLSKILEQSLTFTELLKETGFSRSTLTQHLKDLQRTADVEKAIENNRVIYKPTKKAIELPIFEIFAYHKMISTLFKSGEPLPLIFRVEPTEKHKERAIYWDLNPDSLKDISEKELLQSIDKWLSPIVFFSIVREIKTGKAWTIAVQGILERILHLVKQKDLNKFDEALRTFYSNQFDSLNSVLERVEREKQIHTHFDKLFDNYSFSRRFAK